MSLLRHCCFFIAAEGKVLNIFKIALINVGDDCRSEQFLTSQLDTRQD